MTSIIKSTPRQLNFPFNQPAKRFDSINNTHIQLSLHLPTSQPSHRNSTNRKEKSNGERHDAGSDLQRPAQDRRRGPAGAEDPGPDGHRRQGDLLGALWEVSFLHPAALRVIIGFSDRRLTGRCTCAGG